MYFALRCLYHLYVVSTLKWAAARSVGGIHAGREFPETHLVHSKSPGSTLTFSLPSCCRPVYTKATHQILKVELKLTMVNFLNVPEIQF